MWLPLIFIIHGRNYVVFFPKVESPLRCSVCSVPPHTWALRLWMDVSWHSRKRKEYSSKTKYMVGTAQGMYVIYYVAIFILKLKK